MDFIAPAVPIGLGFGRLGNFVNGELYGRITDVPWGMVFPFVGPEARHPSQLYEFLLEGVVLCIWLDITLQTHRAYHHEMIYLMPKIGTTLVG